MSWPSCSSVLSIMGPCPLAHGDHGLVLEPRAGPSCCRWTSLWPDSSPRGTAERTRAALEAEGP